MLSKKCQFAVAPMMRYTDPHFLMLMRIMSKEIELYTEMVTANAFMLASNNAVRYRRNPEISGKIILQLGGCDPKLLGECTLKATEYGYDGVNLNVGCPSNRVVSGKMGAALMYEPSLVASCIGSMLEKQTLPVSVKTRVGVDQIDDLGYLVGFVREVRDAGCKHFIVHARKAWLKGLNPKQNRTIPKLNYQMVFDLKKNFPNERIDLNGGLDDLSIIANYIGKADGFMIGRKAYQDPFWINQIDGWLSDQTNQSLSREEIVKQYLDYAAFMNTQGVSYKKTLRHLFNIYRKCPGSALWRKNIHKMMMADKLNKAVLGVV